MEFNIDCQANDTMLCQASASCSKCYMQKLNLNDEIVSVDLHEILATGIIQSKEGCSLARLRILRVFWIGEKWYLHLCWMMKNRPHTFVNGQARNDSVIKILYSSASFYCYVSVPKSQCTSCPNTCVLYFF